MITNKFFPISSITLETLASVYLEIMDGTNTKLGFGSGFIAKFGSNYYLITAKHVLLGISDPQGMDDQPSYAKFINTNCFLMGRNSAGMHLENRAIFVDLYSCDGTRNWRQAFQWDIAAIDITDRFDKNSEQPIAIDLSEVLVQTDEEGNSIGVSADEYLPEVGSDVFIVGYPGNFRYLTENKTALWKRASISSEPHIALDERPIFLVDTQGASGLSGSPVLSKSLSLVSPLGYKRDPECKDTRFRLVGIYCGREGHSPDAISLSMGRVFNRSAIQNTIME